MKKNLRIVSAAAAALLAVAPVAATSVSTAFAADAGQVTIKPGTGTPVTTNTLDVNVVLNNPGALTTGSSVSDLNATIQPNQGEVNLTNSTSQVFKADQMNEGKTDTIANATASAKFDAKGDYYLVVKGFSIKGLKPNTDYTFSSSTGKVTINGNTSGKVTTDNEGNAYISTLVSPVITIGDSTTKGAPYVVAKKADGSADTNSITSGTVPLNSSNNSVKQLVDAIQNAFVVKTTLNGGTNGTLKSGWTNLEGDVRAGLKTAGITPKTDANGSFDIPAAPFSITANIYANNGTSGTFVINVNPAGTTVADASYPVISYKVKGKTAPVLTPELDANNTGSANRTIENIDDVLDGKGVNPISFNYVPVNGVVDTTAIKDAFTAKVATGNDDTLGVNVDVSKVNTKVAGKYPVVVSATNADKKTSKVTFYITVGVKGASYKTVQSDGDVPVYKIEGNTVTDTKTTVKNGDQIAVFGDAIKVGDKSYTRINSADSNLYVETKYVDGSFKPAEKTSKTVMHNAYIYDKDHKRVGTKTLAAYTKVDVLGATTKLADGSLVYQIGDNQYVMADNIDGTVRTLSHNAYVYKTSKKRADSRVLRKGAKVTTYGSPYTFKNGKAYYRIGGPSKQYVKVANFN